MNAQEYQETLEFLAQTPQRVADLVLGFDHAAIRLKPDPEAFSALEQICHLRDVEREAYTLRVKRILREDNPLLDGIDGARLAIERDYQSQDPATAIKDFAAARELSLRLLRGASAADQQRPARFVETGDLTLAGLAGLMREHDAGHLAELEALREHLLHAQEAVAIRIQ
jgi:hypothetical protein